jgi:outer membrane immunogenic protein
MSMNGPTVSDVAKSFVYPISILNLGLVGFKQELSSNQVTARIGYKF